MTYTFSLRLLCFISFLCVAHMQCVNRYTETKLPVDPNTLKTNATTSFRWPIGIVATFTGAVVTASSLMQLAANEINNDPAFLKDVFLDLKYTDVKNVQSNTLLASLYQIEQNNVRGIAGGYFSVETQNAQLAAKIYSIPQISGKATTASLSDKVTYPYFVRATLGDTLQSVAVIEILKHYNWTDILLIYSNEDYGVRGNVILRDEASMEIASVQIANSATQNFAEPLAAVDKYISEGKRIIVFYTLSAPGVAFFKALNGSYLGEQYVWIFTTPIATALLEAPANIESVRHNLDGAMLILPASGRGSVYETEKAKWNSLNTTIWPGVRPDPYSLWYWYDTIYVFAHALNDLMMAGRNPNNISYAEYHQAILKVNFQGVTGKVNFDKSGDLICDTAIISFVNGANDLLRVGTFKADTRVLDIQQEAVFWGGSTVVPLDGPIIPVPTSEVPLGIKIVFAVLFGLLGFAALVMLGIVFFFRMAFTNQGIFYCTVVLSGTLIAYGAGAVAVPVPSDGLCTAFPWLLGVGFVLVYGCLFIKTWALFQVFRSAEKMKKVSLTPFFIFKWLCVAVSVEVIYLIIWTTVDRPTVVKKMISGAEQLECGPGNEVFWAVFIAIKGIWMVMGGVISYLVRNVREDYNESKSIAMAVYNCLGVTLVATALAYILNDPNAVVVVQMMAIILVFTFTIIVLFIKPVSQIRNRNKQVDTHLSGRSSKSNSNSHSQSPSASHTSSKVITTDV